MIDLDAVLGTVRDRIGRYHAQSIGEQDTKATLIVPVLRALGWDVEDLEDVKLEYKRRSADNPVDYALFLLREPRLFIEAKQLGSRLDDPRWANQFLTYAMSAGVEWVALTDGDEYRLYNSHAAVPVERKLFRTVRISEPDSRPGDTLRLLSKSDLQDHLIDQYWKSEFVDRQLGDTLRALFAPEPDPSLVRLVGTRAPSLSKADIRASLARLRPTFDFPVVVPRATPVKDPAPAARTSSRAAKPDLSSPQGTQDGTPWRHVTLDQLVGSGLVKPPVRLERRYKGTVVTATIEAPDRIMVGKDSYDSLSTAAGMARKAIIGETPGRRYPQTNGWTFWQIRQGDGTLRELDALRRELHERKVVRLPAQRVGA